VEHVSNGAKEASAKILDLVQHARDENIASKEEIELSMDTMKRVMLTVEERTRTVENKQAMHHAQEERRIQQEKEDKQNKQDKQEKKDLEKDKEKDTLNKEKKELQEMLEKEKELRRIVIEDTKEKEIHWEEEREEKKQELLKINLLLEAKELEKARKTNTTFGSSKPPTPSRQELKKFAKVYVLEEMDNVHKKYDKKLLYQVAREVSKEVGKVSFSNEIAMNELSKEMKTMVMKCQLALARQVETQVETAIAQHTKKTITQISTQVNSNIKEEVATHQKVQEDFVKGARETLRMELNQIRQDVEQHLSAKLGRTSSRTLKEKQLMEAQIQQMVVRTVNDVVVEQQRQLTNTNRNGMDEEQRNKKHFRDDLKSLREDLNRVTESVNGTADHYVYLRDELNNIKESDSGNGNIGEGYTTQYSINLNGGIDSMNQEEEEDILSNVMDELKAWTTKSTTGDSDSDDGGYYIFDEETQRKVPTRYAKQQDPPFLIKNKDKSQRSAQLKKKRVVKKSAGMKKKKTNTNTNTNTVKHKHPWLKLKRKKSNKVSKRGKFDAYL
tara:strand:+ start:226 stop:1893 length:1668 start_codon:yes stop_codon:yes gene_type:complete